jgi:hypothetical protein
MAENNDVLRCPLCHGHGELRRTELEHWFADPDFRTVLEGYLIKFRPSPTDEVSAGSACGCASQKTNGQGDFQKEVHRWNPELPIFRRSPKE